VTFRSGNAYDMRRMKRSLGAMAVAVLLGAGSACLFPWSRTTFAATKAASITPNVAVGPQYDTTHIYVAAEDFDRFVASLVATFGGTAVQQAAATTITPTPSSTRIGGVLTPAGTFSVFGFKTPIPYPFGAERTGYLVSDLDAAVRAARTAGAAVVVAPWNDPIGRDAILQWPGGVNMQIYWHPTPPSYSQLQSVPENRVYVSPDRADAFIRSFLAFSHGKLVSDEKHAPDTEIGRPSEIYRRVRLDSTFGKVTVLVTDGHLPYPYGRELTGYEAANLADTLDKAKAAGVSILVPPYTSDGRTAAMVQFPGGYIAELHSAAEAKARH
jgi:predicted enzyme related to lactoylglutathione lyase